MTENEKSRPGTGGSPETATILNLPHQNIAQRDSVRKSRRVMHAPISKFSKTVAMLNLQRILLELQLTAIDIMSVQSAIHDGLIPPNAADEFSEWWWPCE